MKKSKVNKWSKQLPFYCLLLSLVLLSACKYDDSELTGRVDNLENRLAELEKQCRQINININSLQELITTLDDRDYITAVSEYLENEVKVGYKIEFAQKEPIIIYHGKDGSNGSDGTDGYVPAIGAEKDKDGIYYWTIDGKWMLDKEGKKIKAVGTDGKNGADGTDGSDGQDGTGGTDGRDGITPKIRINNERWEVSYNNGASWNDLGPATSGATPSPITDVQIEDEYVIFTLDTGNEIQLPLYAGKLTLSFETNLVELETGGTVELSYELSRTSNVKVSAIGEGVHTKIDETRQKLTITAEENFNGGKVIVHATDGNIVAIAELEIQVIKITYIEYTAATELTPSDEAFGGKGIQFFKEKSTFDPSTGKGKWAYKGEPSYVKDFAFNNTPLKSITFPESITDIGRPDPESQDGGSVFEDSQTIESVTIKGEVKEIRINTFKNCTNLKEVNLPESLIEIKRQAFLGCSSLEKIVIPAGVTEMGNKVFASCPKLATIVCLGTTPAKLGENVFMADKTDWDNIKYIKEIIVPSSAVETYKQADGWKNFKDRIEGDGENNS
ncbi:MAG: leucine-rich repeat protein [Parabacteroides gordonii]|nr:leucine-rich repeat protein [Parabacteroides gordonii]